LVAGARKVVANLGPLVEPSSERCRPFEVFRSVFAHCSDLRIEVGSFVGAAVYGSNVAKTGSPETVATH